MKCYYTYDDKGKKHLIPMCYGTINSQNISGCNCPEPITEYSFQKKRYNEVLEEKNKIIKQMDSELNHLRKVIISLTKPREV